MARKGLVFQYFEWYMETQNDLWIRLKDDAKHLKEMGVTGVWIPPATKATSGYDTGYGVYDLYDLGEFDQNGGVKTKYGSKEELLAAIQALHEEGIDVYADVVLNHKANGDQKEKFTVVEMNPANRTEVLSEPFEMEGWTGFTYPARGGKYSNFEWHWIHFTGTDFNASENRRGLFQIQGINKGWAQGVSGEFGNFDYLMFNDVDFKHPDVVTELHNWAKWFVRETGVDGFRFDAVKHINDWFMRDLIKDLKNEFGEDFYAVGEYWNEDLGTVENYLANIDYEMDLFDVKLHYNFYRASLDGHGYDMRSIFDGTLVKAHAEYCITFVDNHDSQPGQALQSWVQPWFKPLAYALILLRRDGYPKIFFGDYYGVAGPNGQPGHQEEIDKLLYVRNNHAYGEQVDYFDDMNLVGFVRMGDEVHPYGCAVVMSSGEGGVKKMNVGQLNKGAVYADYLGRRTDKITIDENGDGLFPCNGGQVSVWVRDQVSPDDAFNEEKVVD